MMKTFFIRMMLVFLLFSITAETFSSLFFSNRDQISFAEKEEQENDAKKEKDETKKDQLKDKYFASVAFYFINIDPSSLNTGYFHPELIGRRSDPPEIPPEQI